MGSWRAHKGDIGNIEIDSLGNGTLKMATDQWCLGCDDSTKNIIGPAISFIMPKMISSPSQQAMQAVE
jgi:hypothetical protein